ncbi:MAG TPA: glycosyltransferase family 4 protein [Cyclobacteriaceae bacterium]|nr:glycosyltransferase family 4 protein [Cyclobacteriaceae bacterium]
MKVIYVHQYFKTPGEGGAIRSFHLAKGLVEAGIEVEMVTAHNRGHYEVHLVEGIKVHYLPISYEPSYGMLRRIWAFRRFVSAAKKLIAKLPRPDLFYITSTPLTVGQIGLWVKKTLAIPYIFEVRDLWPEAPIQIGMVKNPLLKKMLYRLEKSIYEQALRIVALSPGIKNYIVAKVPDAQVELIPNIADTRFFSPSPKDIRTLQRLGLTDCFTLSYTGALGKVNALQHFLFLAKAAMEEEKNWQFVLMGQGAKEVELRQLAAKLQLKNLTLMPFGNKSQVRDVLSVTDMVYISFDDQPVLQSNSPNKFFDALAAGKAIVINHQGWIASLVKEHQLGIYHAKDDHPSALQALSRYADHPEWLQAAQNRSRKLGEQYFSKGKAIHLLLHTLDPKRYKLDPNERADNLIV